MRRIEEPLTSAVNYVKTSFFGNKNKDKDDIINNNENNKDDSKDNNKDNGTLNNEIIDSKETEKEDSKNTEAINNNDKSESNDDIKKGNTSTDILKSNSQPDTDTNKNNNNNNNNNNNSLYWNILGIGTAVVAGAAAIYSTIVNKDARDSVFFNGQQILAASSNYLLTYGQFLEPLVGVGNQYNSIDYLIENNVPFKNYYPITKIKNGEETTQLTFISLPTEEKYLKLFDSVPGAENATDTIYSHINMFNMETNSFNVFHLLDKCIQDIYNILRII